MVDRCEMGGFLRLVEMGCRGFKICRISREIAWR